MTSVGKLALVFSTLTMTLLGVWLFGQSSIATMIIPPSAELPDGAKYYGDVEDGRFHGKGKLVWRNGDVLVGQFVHGLASGKGKQSYSTGAEYEGEFKDGQRSGHGTLTMDDGSVYEGQFVAGAFDGQGRLTYHNGNVYVGEFKDNLLHGEGRYTDARTGDWYKGEFLRSAFTGQGTYVDKSGNRYEGAFRDWRFHGQGKYVSEGGFYEGRFEDGSLNGRGSYQGMDGVRYEGEFVDWIYEGEGTLVEESGDTYTGEFKYGTYDGQGTLVYAEPQDGLSERGGTWSYGFFDDGEITGDTSNAWVEAALYNQGDLLSDALKGLEPSRDNHIDLYFVGVAGWAEQDVFLKEVEFARSQFDENFDTRARSITLVNNPATVDERPLATVTGIRRTLSYVSSIMNPEEDILFLFLTSHGSKRTGVALEHGVLPLTDLSPEDMAEILNATNIKWKVLVVSACYSGSFVETVKDDHTLIMTAASAEKESFGCSDDADLTYFGRAYFERSLPSSDSFASAFTKARDLIHEWELDQGQHSEPQIHEPRAILRHLGKWRSQLGASAVKSE